MGSSEGYEFTENDRQTSVMYCVEQMWILFLLFPSKLKTNSKAFPIVQNFGVSSLGIACRGLISKPLTETFKSATLLPAQPQGEVTVFT